MYTQIAFNAGKEKHTLYSLLNWLSRSTKMNSSLVIFFNVSMTKAELERKVKKMVVYSFWLITFNVSIAPNELNLGFLK